MRTAYRIRQVLQYLTARPQPGEMAQAMSCLTSAERALFLQLPVADQSHSLRVWSALSRAGESDRDLLAAALLHDIGKLRYRLHLWERVLIVLARKLVPGWVERIGSGSARGWRRPFAVSVQHAEWGSDMLAATQSNPRTIEIVRWHQGPIERARTTKRQIRALQAADNES